LGSLSLQSKAPATRIMKILGALVACIFAIVIPFWYYMLSVSEIRDSLTIETVFIAKSIEKVIQTRPDMWEFESARLQEIVSQTALHEKPCERIIRNAAGTVVAKTDIVTRRPVVSASVALFDSGRPVGSLEARHSIRTPVVFTVLLGILSSFLGTLIYVIFRTYPIKKLDNTLADLQRAEEEQRLSREIAERLARETVVIADIGRLIGSTLDIEEVYERFAAEARNLIPFDSLIVNLKKPREDTLDVAYASGANIPERRKGDSFPLKGSVSEFAMRTRTGLIVRSADILKKTDRFSTLGINLQAGLHSMMSAPLISRDEAIGALVFRMEKPNAYTERDLRLAERIGAQIAGAIANAQILDNIERLAKETAIMAEIGRLIGSTLDIEEVYERFAAEARNLIPFDRIAVNLFNIHENTLTIAYVSGADISNRKRGDSPPLAGTLTEEVIRGRTGLIIQPESPESIDEIVSRIPGLSPTFQAGLRSLLSVPLISRDEVIGVLHFRTKKPNAYSEQDLRLAERIGAQIAGAIANAQLFIDLKRTETSLRESESRFRALFEQAAVGVAEIVMETGQFITVNHRLCELVGRTEEEMLATTFHAITHPDDLHLHEDKTVLLRAGKIGHYNLEKRYLRKDGGIVWVDITVSPLWKPGEEPGRNIAVVEDITARKRMEEEIREMSFRDQLTELYNRRGFTALAEQQLKAANRAQRPMLFIFIDCDGLKRINDTLGHEEGDKSLIDTANVLRQTFRESDIIARLGGDEFAILSIDAADMNHEDFSRRLQQHIDACNAKESRQYKLSLSWGTAIYNPESPISLDQLISAADELMYAQKKAKSNKRM
jgi:diguanylate cyclase (GGDEF)-like protein/PAS domain S-box-containing protein